MNIAMKTYQSQNTHKYGAQEILELGPLFHCRMSTTRTEECVIQLPESTKNPIVAWRVQRVRLCISCSGPVGTHRTRRASSDITGSSDKDGQIKQVHEADRIPGNGKYS